MRGPLAVQQAWEPITKTPPLCCNTMSEFSIFQGCEKRHATVVFSVTRNHVLHPNSKVYSSEVSLGGELVSLCQGFNSAHIAHAPNTRPQILMKSGCVRSMTGPCVAYYPRLLPCSNTTHARQATKCTSRFRSLLCLSPMRPFRLPTRDQKPTYPIQEFYNISKTRMAILAYSI